MSADVVALIIGCLLVLGFYFFLKKTYNFFESIVIVDIFLRVINYICNNLELKGFLKTIDTYLPNSIESLIDIFTKSVLKDVLIFVYVTCFVVFLVKAIKKAF